MTDNQKSSANKMLISISNELLRLLERNNQASSNKILLSFSTELLRVVERSNEVIKQLK